MNEDAAPPPSLESFMAFGLAEASPLGLVGLLLGGLYLAGALRLWLQRRRWSVLRTIAYLLGCAFLTLTTVLGVNRYAESLVSVLVFQQITLMTVVPPLLVVGSPGRLLLRATPHAGLGLAILRAAHAGLRSRTARLALHPAVAPLVVVALFPGLYLTDLVSPVMSTPLGHELLLAIFLVSGVVAATPLWSSDPLPRAPSFGARLADVFVEIQVHAVFGLVLLMSGEPLFAAYLAPPSGFGVDPVDDQAIAGTLAWTYGELPLLVVLIVTLSKWNVGDTRRARRNQERDEAELERYNARLAGLRDRQQR